MKKIITQENYAIAYNWIINQINKNTFSDNGFKEIVYADYESLSSWCNENLKPENIKRLRGTIRQTLSKRKIGSRQITLNSEAHIILKDMAKHQGLTLSELIIDKLKSEWLELSEPEEATETMAASTEPAHDDAEPASAPANSPIIATNEIILPESSAEYNQLVDRLKHSPEWQTKNGQVQNLARIFKAHGVLLPDGKMSKAGLNKYLKEL